MIKQNPSKQIVLILRKCFNHEEFRDLLLELNISEDALSGTTSDGKKRELVEYMQRRNRLPELITLIKENRPHIHINFEQYGIILKNVMQIRYTRHARQRMKQRKVTEKQVRETLTDPDEVEPGDNGGNIAIRRYGWREVHVVYGEPEENIYVIYTVIKPRIR